jgi:hypothetical protein
MINPEVNTNPVRCRLLRNGGGHCQLFWGGATIADVLSALPDLNMNGFRGFRFGPFFVSDSEHKRLRERLRNHHDRAKSIDGFPSEERLSRLGEWLRFFERARQWTRSTSYGLKHTFERETGIYVPSGLFIAAVLLACFETKFWADSTEAVFKMRRRELR